MDKNYWNTLFQERKIILPPEKFLEKNYHHLKGKVLDLACGDGRNTIFLSQQGFKVIAVDFSETALRKIKYFKIFEITTHLCDLETIDEFKRIKGYDSVLINHYSPTKEVLLEIQENLEVGSSLIMVAFADSEETYSFNFDEIEGILTGMKTVKRETYSNEIGSFNGLILEKI